MARPNITDVQEDTTDGEPRDLTIEYRTSAHHTFKFSVTTLPWRDDEENPVAFCEWMEQDAERYGLAPDDLPDEVREEVEGRGYTVEVA